MDDIELKLLLGQPIPIEGLGKIYSPSTDDVAELGYSVYNEYLSRLLVNKDKIQATPEEKEQLTTFKVIISLCVYDEDFREVFVKALEFMFKESVHLGQSDSDVFFYLGNIEDQRFITQDNIELIQVLVRLANQVKVQDEEDEESSYNPADEVAAKIIAEMLERRRNKPKPKPTINFHSIVSGLSNKSNSINYLNIGQLSIYQLYDKFHRQEVMENYHYTLVGIYSGNVDGKKVNYNKIHWTKILNQEN